MSFRVLFRSLTSFTSLLFVATMAWGSPINYGDLNGTNVDYLQVTEAASSPGDSTPLYGAPIVVGNTLAFPTIQNHSFMASASGATATSDTTIGTLSFTFQTNNHADLSALHIAEGGDYSFLGNTGTTSAIFASLNVQIWATSAKITPLDSDSQTFSRFFTGPLAETAFWQNSSTFDLSPLQRDSVFVVVNNNLQATSNSNNATAFIQKKQFTISNIPEPATMVLVGSGVVLLLATRRRTRA